jgi:hypothetical protein
VAGVVGTPVLSLVHTVADKAKFKEVEVALSISGEGSIGIDTAGVEAFGWRSDPVEPMLCRKVTADWKHFRPFRQFSHSSISQK